MVSKASSNSSTTKRSYSANRFRSGDWLGSGGDWLEGIGTLLSTGPHVQGLTPKGTHFPLPKKPFLPGPSAPPPPVRVGTPGRRGRVPSGPGRAVRCAFPLSPFSPPLKSRPLSGLGSAFRAPSSPVLWPGIVALCRRGVVGLSPLCPGLSCPEFPGARPFWPVLLLGLLSRAPAAGDGSAPSISSIVPSG